MKTRTQTLLQTGLCLLVTFGITHSAAAQTTVYDLNSDWSDASNPNGVWSYRAGPTLMHSQMGSPHVPAGQVVWVGPDNYLPIWFKFISPDAYDFHTGDVVVHSANSDAEGIANIAWTAPSDGKISVSGAVWIAIQQDGRSSAWSLWLNGALLTSGQVSWDDAYDRASPFLFSLGSGGAGVLQNLSVSAGDEVVLQVRRESGPYGTYVGANFSVAFTAGPPPPCVEPPSALMAWWRGENSAADNAGANHGILRNGTTFAAGKVGQAFSFDGIDDAVEVPHQPDQNPGGQLTLEAWIRPDNRLNTHASIINKRSAGNNRGYTLELLTDVGQNGLNFEIQTTAGVFQRLVSDVLTANAWQHVAASYDGATMRVYVNGTEVAAAPASGTINPVADDLVIGRNIVNGMSFPGLIDEPTIYNRALSAAEIQPIYAAGSAGKCFPCLPPPSGLVAWWDGDLVEGTTVGDRIGGHNGTALNGVSLVAGMVGQALGFDGVDDVVSIPHDAALQPPLMTVDAWIVAQPSLSGDHQLIIDKSHGFGDATGWALQIHPDGRVGWAYGNGSGFPEALSTTVVTDNQPHLIAGTFNGASLDLYVDGILEGSVPFSGTPAGNDRPVHIGASWGGDFNYASFVRHFYGLIDEVELFDRALAATEIQAIYNAGSAGKCKQSNQPPVARCQNVTVLASADCQADVAAGQVDSGSSDPDGDPLTLTLTPAGPYPVGTSEVVLTVDDGKGGSSSCSATVVVVDNTPPSITCPASLIVPFGSVPAAATTAAELMAQGGLAFDNCDSNLRLSSSDALQGSCPQSVTRTYSATDAAGNVSTCQQIITVNNLFAADALVWHQPLARNGLSEDTDPSAGGTVKYRFKLGSTIPIQVHALDCAGADVTSNANIIGRVTVFRDSNCGGAVDASATPIDYSGVGGAGGVMDKIDGHLKYNLDTKTLPAGTQCYILRVTITDTSTGEERSEEALLQAK